MFRGRLMSSCVSFLKEGSLVSQKQHPEKMLSIVFLHTIKQTQDAERRFPPSDSLNKNERRKYEARSVFI